MSAKTSHRRTARQTARRATRVLPAELIDPRGCRADRPIR
jgi:hypothetical protein